MSTFNINHIISKYKLDESKLAKELFPSNKFPIIAFKRITSGTVCLDTNQLDILSKIINIQVKDLFVNENWSIDNSHSDKIVFWKNDYRVELESESQITNIYYLDQLIAKETIIAEKNILLSEYLKLVNKVIINLI